MDLLKALYFQVCSPWSMPMSFLSSLSSDGLQKGGHVLHILSLYQFLFFFLILLKGRQHTSTPLTCAQNHRCPEPEPFKGQPCQ